MFYQIDVRYDWAEPPVYVLVGRCWPVLLQNIKPEDTKPSSTTSHSSSQSKVSKKVRYSKYGEISFNLFRIIIKYNSNIKYLTDICFNNGLNVNNKTLLQLNIIGQKWPEGMKYDVITCRNIVNNKLCYLSFLHLSNVLYDLRITQLVPLILIVDYTSPLKMV